MLLCRFKLAAALVISPNPLPGSREPLEIPNKFGSPHVRLSTHEGGVFVCVSEEHRREGDREHENQSRSIEVEVRWEWSGDTRN
jgi:hypothetical protein